MGSDECGFESMGVTSVKPRVGAPQDNAMQPQLNDPKVGGRVKVAVDEDVLKVAQFMVAQHNKKGANLVLGGVQEAETQIMNGVHYHLKLQITDYNNDDNGATSMQFSARRDHEDQLYML
jgi:hypothetical protein